MLDLIDETLHQVPLFVEVPVIVAGLLAVFAGRNDRFDCFVGKDLQKIIGIVRAIGDQELKFIICDQCFCLSNVMTLPGGQKKAQRVPQGIDIYMNLGAKPTSTPSECLSGLTTVFFSAPATQGCARTTVLSRMTFSMSGSSAKC